MGVRIVPEPLLVALELLPGDVARVRVGQSHGPLVTRERFDRDPPTGTVVVLHPLLRQRPPLVRREHPWPTEMPLVPKCRGEPNRERQVTRTTTLGDRHMSFPDRSQHGQPFPRQVHIGPFQCHYLPAAESCFAAREHDDVRAWVDVEGSFDLWVSNSKFTR